MTLALSISRGTVLVQKIRSLQFLTVESCNLARASLLCIQSASGASKLERESLVAQMLQRKHAELSAETGRKTDLSPKDVWEVIENLVTPGEKYIFDNYQKSPRLHGTPPLGHCVRCEKTIRRVPPELACVKVAKFGRVIHGQYRVDINSQDQAVVQFYCKMCLGMEIKRIHEEHGKKRPLRSVFKPYNQAQSEVNAYNMKKRKRTIRERISTMGNVARRRFRRVNR